MPRRLALFSLNRKLKEEHPDDSVLHYMFGAELLTKCKDFKIFKKKFKYTYDSTRITVKNSDHILANAIRRIILKDVETVTPHFIDLYINTSALPDEMLAQRIGAVPLKCDPKNLKPINSEDPELLEESMWIKGSINIVNDREKDLEICSGDFMLENGYSFVDDNVPITILKSEQQLHCDILCIRGNGELHAKWMPVTVVAFEKKGDDYIIRFEPMECITTESLVEQTMSKLFERVKKYYDCKK